MGKIKYAILIFSWAVLLLGAKECDPPGEAGTCNPGENQPCMCDGAEWGIHYCNTSGRDWSRCKCAKEYQKSSTPADEASPSSDISH